MKGTKLNPGNKIISSNDEDHLSVNFDKIRSSLVMHGVNCEKYTDEINIRVDTQTIRKSFKPPDAMLSQFSLTYIAATGCMQMRSLRDKQITEFKKKLISGGKRKLQRRMCNLL